MIVGRNWLLIWLRRFFIRHVCIMVMVLMPTAMTMAVMPVWSLLFRDTVIVRRKDPEKREMYVRPLIVIGRQVRSRVRMLQRRALHEHQQDQKYRQDTANHLSSFSTETVPATLPDRP